MINYYKIVSYFHIFIIGPLLLYFYFKKNNSHPLTYKLSLLIGVFGFFIHLHKFIYKKYKKYIYLLHLIAFTYIFINIGYYKEKTKYHIWNLSLLFGVGAILHYVKRFINI